MELELGGEHRGWKGEQKTETITNCPIAPALNHPGGKWLWAARFTDWLMLAHRLPTPVLPHPQASLFLRKSGICGSEQGISTWCISPSPGAVGVLWPVVGEGPVWC